MDEKQLLHGPSMDTLQAAALSLLVQLIDVQRKTNIKVSGVIPGVSKQSMV